MIIHRKCARTPGEGGGRTREGERAKEREDSGAVKYKISQIYVSENVHLYGLDKK